MISVVIEAAIALGFTFGGGLQALHTLTAGWFEPGMLRSLALKVYGEGVVDAMDAQALWDCELDGLTGPWVTASLDGG